MATPTPTVTDVGTSAVLVTWALTTADHTGLAIGPEITSIFPNVTWHANGATWGSATAAAEGSNTDTTAHYGPVKNADGGASITFTVDGGTPATHAIAPAYLRARLSVVGTGATINVVAYCTKTPKASRTV